MKWTKGPWEVSGSIIGRFVDGRREWTHIATFYTADGEGPANAHLIAAAPELVEYVGKQAEAGDPEAARLWRLAHGER